MPDRSFRPLPPRPFVPGGPGPVLRSGRSFARSGDGAGSGPGTRGTASGTPGGGAGGPGGTDTAGGSASGGGQGVDETSDGRRGGQEDNPFAPPPEGAPDRPWEPRRPGRGPDSGSGADSGDRGRGASPWGRQWSDQQPGRSQGGGFGDRPGRQERQGADRDPDGSDGPGGGPAGLRWDPTDPAQRRARYALLSGMWAFFFALFGWRYPALLLGALAVYWGVSSLRAKPAKPRTPDPAAAPERSAAGDESRSAGGAGVAASGGKPQTTAAVSGLVTAVLALAMVAATFTAQLVYRDYYTCVNDSLTTTARHSCDHLLPQELRSVLGTES